jgi:uncharacterized protein YbaA (DUF1428 family)
MSLLKKAIVFFCIVIVACVASRGYAHAYVLASSDMHVFDLRFLSPDPAAELQWTDEWYGTVEAHAQDTASGSVSDFKELLGNDGNIKAQADTAYVHSWAEYTVIDGANVAIDPDARIDGVTHSDLEISALGEQGDGDARTNFDNFFKVFTVLGGNPGDPVDVTFELDYSGQLAWSADELGYFSTALAGLLSVEGQFWDDQEKKWVSKEVASSVWKLHSGTNDTDSRKYDGTLRVSGTIQYEADYWLYAEADSEVYGANAIPEPGTLFLLLAGAPFIIRKHIRKQNRV